MNSLGRERSILPIERTRRDPAVQLGSNRHERQFIKQIEYEYYDDSVNNQRVSALATLHGPKGKLYVQMLPTGEVRAYDVATGCYTPSSRAARSFQTDLSPLD